LKYRSQTGTNFEKDRIDKSDADTRSVHIYSSPQDPLQSSGTDA